MKHKKLIFFLFIYFYFIIFIFFPIYFFFQEARNQILSSLSGHVLLLCLIFHLVLRHDFFLLAESLFLCKKWWLTKNEIKKFSVVPMSTLSLIYKWKN